MSRGKKTALDLDSKKLRHSLREAGLSDEVIDAAWPSWWNDDLSADRSGQAELRFALARKLGVSPRGLLGERVNFIWNDEAKFKHLSTEDKNQRAALTSFGVTIGRILIHSSSAGIDLKGINAHSLREAILTNERYVDLNNLISFCWGVGIPVIHLRVFPLEAKSMHAMVVKVDGRYAILIGRDASYPALISFTLAHELGHIFCGHLSDVPALVDLKDPATAEQQDDQEKQADQFAIYLLTGQSEPNITTSVANFNAPSLAKSVLEEAPKYGIEPGVLALCVAYRTGAWARAMAALKFIYGEQKPMWRVVNTIALSQLDWDVIGSDSEDYLNNVMDTRA